MHESLELLTVSELAEELGIGRTAAYALLREGKIKSLKNGRDWKIPRIAVEEYILNSSGLSSSPLMPVKNRRGGD